MSRKSRDMGHPALRSWNPMSRKSRDMGHPAGRGTEREILLWGIVLFCSRLHTNVRFRTNAMNRPGVFSPQPTSFEGFVLALSP